MIGNQTINQDKYKVDADIIEKAYLVYEIEYADSSNKPDQRYIEYMLYSLQLNFDRIQEHYKFVPKSKIKIKLYTNRVEYNKTHIGIDRDFSVRGVFTPEEEKIFFLIDRSKSEIQPSDFDYLATHELAHYFQFNKFNKNFLQGVYPFWFLEGLAEHEALSERLIENDNQSAKELLQSIKSYTEYVYYLDNPTNGEDVTNAYASSRSFIDFLLNKYGIEKLIQVGTQTKSTGAKYLSFNSTYRNVTQNTVEKDFEEWKTMLNQ